jgi:endonuclease YncB( thermonuclease family)
VLRTNNIRKNGDEHCDKIAYMRLATFFLSLSLTLPLAAGAGELPTLVGKVVRISDGDTLVILQDNQQIRIRLAEIDAPEIGQPFGKRSREHLASLCAGVIAQIVVQGKDRYGRTLGRVHCKGVDTNAALVRVGLAWVYDRYVSDPSFYKLQEAARRERIGLWSDRNPVPPWVWRTRREP